MWTQELQEPSQQTCSFQLAHVHFVAVIEAPKINILNKTSRHNQLFLDESTVSDFCASTDSFNTIHGLSTPLVLAFG